MYCQYIVFQFHYADDEKRFKQHQVDDTESKLEFTIDNKYLTYTVNDMKYECYLTFSKESSIQSDVFNYIIDTVIVRTRSISFAAFVHYGKTPTNCGMDLDLYEYQGLLIDVPEFQAKIFPQLLVSNNLPVSKPPLIPLTTDDTMDATTKNDKLQEMEEHILKLDDKIMELKHSIGRIFLTLSRLPH